jgi:hypothetical protein
MYIWDYLKVKERLSIIVDMIKAKYFGQTIKEDDEKEDRNGVSFSFASSVSCLVRCKHLGLKQMITDRPSGKIKTGA